jgi:hypothetical protein
MRCAKNWRTYGGVIFGGGVATESDCAGDAIRYRRTLRAGVCLGRDATRLE